ncbi:MAG: response regulator transcription factor [Chloroflexi bacterium]|nr:response regulator transcription factor [Chloroflexota bacterium]
MSIHILIVDNSSVFRQYLRRTCELAGDFEVIGQAQNGHDAVALVRDLQPDIVLMNIDIPIMDSVQTTKLITTQNPSTRVIALTTVCTKKGHVLAVIKAGAHGCLPKDTKERVLIGAIQAVHRGEALIDPHVTAQVFEELRRTSDHTMHLEKE